ncbi:MAG: leucyl/phenylalanyl-tRNA--protein transferase [Gammaproteobacteria bacterium]|nr:leucyl/phenylalanyl-tRNA--protein transferase [Gammaproteobacteria bacterium]
MNIFPIQPDDEHTPFPDTDWALNDPNGLLAFGAQLTPKRLLMAYRNGIFPWYNPGEPILWWSPDPRCVLWPEHIHISRSLRKLLKKKPFELRKNSAFSEVMQACSEPRLDEPSTWISADMKAAYTEMHRLGYAHSIECWMNGELVGGLYGIQLGSVFFGESMFSRIANASKVALVDLAQNHSVSLIDGQVSSPHLHTLGATTLPRKEFLAYLQCLIPNTD